MKKLLLLAAAVLVFGNVVMAQSDSVSLRVGQQKKARSSKLQVKFLSVIEDSRCPAGVNCIWAGNAKIKLRVSSSRMSKDIEINTTAGPQGDQVDGWAINLVGLTPAPTAKGAPAARAYTAKLTINRLTR